jgi:Na+-transporting methylmalonyl-CoA/oxaloacetate decarboxylase gamma subunit
LLFDDTLTVAIITVGVIIAACLIVVFAMRRRGEKEKKTKEEELQADLKGYPFRVSKSVPAEDASHAKDELRILDLEREILSDAIRRLYEAHAEGKITEEERDRLAQTYKSRMMTVKDAISKDESVVALHELEGMQQDLMKLFSEKFDDLTSKIEELRTKTEIKPIKEITIAPKALTKETPAVEEEKATDEEKARKKRKPSPAKPTPRTEAEKRIEEIRAEVEKVLDKLGQMEIEP